MVHHPMHKDYNCVHQFNSACVPVVDINLEQEPYLKGPNVPYSDVQGPDVPYSDAFKDLRYPIQTSKHSLPYFPFEINSYNSVPSKAG